MAVVALLLLLGSPLLAQDRARKLMVKGRFLAQVKKDCPAALEVLRKAGKLATNARVRGHIHLNIAVCLMKQGDRPGALAALHLALVDNPRLKYYAGRYDKAMQGIFAEAIKMLTPAAAATARPAGVRSVSPAKPGRPVKPAPPDKPLVMGTLSVISNLPDSVVYVDGKVVGPAPFLGPIPVGKHSVHVRTRDGKWRHHESVILGPDVVVTINSPLMKVQGKLTVLSSPPGMRVYVDGEIVGSTPVHKVLIVPGTHTVVVRRAGDEDRERTVKISPDRLTSINFTIKPRAGGGAAAYPGLFVPRKHHTRIWTWVAAGGALAALCVGAGLGISVKSDAEEYAKTSEHQSARLDELEQSMRGKVLSANILFGVSGALAATSVVFFFWEGGYFSKERRRKRSASLRGRVSPIIGNGGAGVIWTTDF